MNNFTLKIYLSSILLFMIGPTWSFVGIPIVDIYFILVVFSILSNSRLTKKIIPFFYLIFSFVTLAFLVRGIIGIQILNDELKNVLTHLKLAVIANMAYIFIINIKSDVEMKEAFLIKKITFIMKLSLLIVSLIALFQYMHIPIIEKIIENIYYNDREDVVMNSLQYFLERDRVNAVFLSALNLSGFLLLLILYTIYMRKQIKNNTFLLILSLSTMALFFTNSRMTLLIFLLFSIYYLGKNFKIKTVFYLIVSIIFISTLLFNMNIQLSDVNLDRLYELEDFYKHGLIPYNAQLKIDLIPAMIAFLFPDILLFLFGTGIDYFRANFFKQSWEIEYFGLIIRYGFIGFVVIVFWHIRTAILFRRYSNQFQDIRKDFLLYVAIAIVVMAALMINQDIVFLNRWREFFFAIIGIGYGIISRGNHNSIIKAYK